MIGSKHARLILGVIGAIAIAELGAAAFAYRPTIHQEHWEAARRAIESGDDDAPVWLATEWIGPRARMALPTVAAIDAATRPDLRGVRRFTVLGVDEAWSRELEADLEDLPPPRVIDTLAIGPLTLTRYEQPQAGELVADLLSDPSGLQVFVDDARCKGQARRWRCNLGHVDRQIAEIDFRPRRCLAVSADDGVPVRLRWPSTTTGGMLRGHVGFHDFNRRLRSDAAAEITVVIDDVPALRMLATDAEGWRPFAVPIDPGTHDLAIEVVLAARGTWDRTGYDVTLEHAPCIELRTLTEHAK